MNRNWNNNLSYGYDTKHSMYAHQTDNKKTQTDVGVGTRQQTTKKCGIIKPGTTQPIGSGSSYCSISPANYK